MCGFQEQEDVKYLTFPWIGEIFNNQVHKYQNTSIRYRLQKKNKKDCVYKGVMCKVRRTTSSTFIYRKITRIHFFRRCVGKAFREVGGI